jgi:hypothetical protein
METSVTGGRWAVGGARAGGPATAGREAGATKSGERWEHEVNATPKLSDGEHTQRTFGVGQAFGRGLGALALTLGVDELDFGQADDAEDGA